MTRDANGLSRFEPSRAESLESLYMSDTRILAQQKFPVKTQNTSLESFASILARFARKLTECLKEQRAKTDPGNFLTSVQYSRKTITGN